VTLDDVAALPRFAGVDPDLVTELAEVYSELQPSQSFADWMSRLQSKDEAHHVCIRHHVDRARLQEPVFEVLRFIVALRVERCDFAFLTGVLPSRSLTERRDVWSWLVNRGLIVEEWRAPAWMGPADLPEASRHDRVIARVSFRAYHSSHTASRHVTSPQRNISSMFCDASTRRCLISKRAIVILLTCCTRSGCGWRLWCLPQSRPPQTNTESTCLCPLPRLCC
jgi:hypothetical protein